MRSYVVKRFPHFRHSRRRRMDSASLLSRESTTLSSRNPQKGHFMALSIEQMLLLQEHQIVAGASSVPGATKLSSSVRGKRRKRNQRGPNRPEIQKRQPQRT